jgi:hypothetical protein
MAGEQVVGRKQQGANTGFVGPRPMGPAVGTNTNTPTFLQNINSRLQGMGYTAIPGAESLSSSDVWVDSLSKNQLSEVAAVFKKLGVSVKSKTGLKALMVQYPQVTTLDYSAGLQLLNNEVIAETVEPKIPTTTITQYTDTQLTDISNAIAQNFLKRNLEQAEIDSIMPKLKKLVEKGTTTTSKKVGGKNVVTVTPGFSTQAATGIVEAELKKTAQDDLQVRQYQDFSDWLSQNMAGM